MWIHYSQDFFKFDAFQSPPSSMHTNNNVSDGAQVLDFTLSQTKLKVDLNRMVQTSYSAFAYGLVSTSFDSLS